MVEENKRAHQHTIHSNEELQKEVVIIVVFAVISVIVLF